MAELEDALNKRMDTFSKAAEPLIKWLCENQHPHSIVIVQCDGAELLEGIMQHKNDTFIKN